jgi:hypothetical protein
MSWTEFGASQKVELALLRLVHFVCWEEVSSSIAKMPAIGGIYFAADPGSRSLALLAFARCRGMVELRYVVRGDCGRDCAREARQVVLISCQAPLWRTLTSLLE